MKFPLASLFVALALAANASGAELSTATTDTWGKAEDGTPIHIYTLRNSNGMEARVSDFGGTLVSLTVPDRDGKMADVLLGFDKAEDYVGERSFYGAILGRYANRIANAAFDLEGQHYQVTANSKWGTLHGGNKGFDRVMWTATAEVTKEGPSVKLTYVSKDGEEGYPGTLTTTAVYTLTDKNELKLDYTATTDKPTVVNLSLHPYFNLKGQGEGDVLDHVVTLYGDKFTPIGDNRMPTGEIKSVEGTALDFRKPATIGARINSDDEQLKKAFGYDHNFIVNRTKPGELALAAKVEEPTTGRVLEVLTTEPGFQFYTDNAAGDTDGNKGGKTYHIHYAFCIEPGHYPDSPNHPNFPTTELKPGETFKSTMIFRFSTDKADKKK